MTTHFSTQNSLIFPDFYGPGNSVGGAYAALDSHTGNPGMIPGANALFVQTLPAFQSVVEVGLLGKQRLVHTIPILY